MDLLTTYAVGAPLAALLTSIVVARDGVRDPLAIGITAVIVGMAWPLLVPLVVVVLLLGHVGRWLSDRIEYNPPWRR